LIHIQNADLKYKDSRFEEIGGGAGEIDWLKCQTVNGTKVCLGVEIQFSARSDLIIDVAHPRRAIAGGKIDVGVIVAPTDRLAIFLTDRGTSISAAKCHFHEARADGNCVVGAVKPK
jgi:hypothetical protein